jgi:16S rRNA (guanine966-N2)-methyltransferase
MLRITGGRFRGRQIKNPTSDSTRPTQSRMRQAWMNSLQTVIGDARVLELFSGSGALGLECLSWGAASVVFVDQAPRAIQCLRENIKTLDVEGECEVLSGSIDRVKDEILPRGPYDLVLADPPYHEGWERKLLEEWPWAELLKPEGLFCLEWAPMGKQKTPHGISSLPDQTASLEKVREKKYGESMLTTYRRVGG